MGREIRRVPFDFNFPIDKTWTGFLNPWSEFWKTCATCDGSGSSADVRFLSDSWYRFRAEEMFDPYYGDSVPAILTVNQFPEADRITLANLRRAKRFGFDTFTHWSDKITQHEVDYLIDKGRLWDFTRKVVDGKWIDRDPVPHPTADDVNAWGRSGGLRGHDGINRSYCVEARAKRCGVKRETCNVCSGEGGRWTNRAAKRKHDRWKPTEPPSGPGWQVWQTVSEGGPVSPVFRSDVECVTWLVSEGYSREAAQNFVKVGWCMSAMMVNGKFYKNIEACAVQEEK